MSFFIPGFDDWVIDPPVDPVPLPAEGLTGKKLASFLTKEVMPVFQDEQARLRKLEMWGEGKQPDTRNHTHPNSEKRVLQRFARNPLLPLMVSIFAQQMIVDGYRRDGARENEEAWDTWEFNNMKAQQFALNRAIMVYGYAYVRVTSGEQVVKGRQMAVLRGVDPQNAFAVYTDPGDEYPAFLLERRFNGTYRWWTPEGYSVFNYSQGSFKHVSDHDHDYGVVPFVRYVNRMDLKGRAWGDVEPLIELAARIDKTVFDRLLVQHYNSFKIKWATGLEQPDTEEEVVGAKFKIANDSVVISSQSDAKFGTFDETNMDPFIKAYRSDFEEFLTAGQCPPELAGLAANLAADAMEGARRSSYQKLFEKQAMTGQSHAQAMRLAAAIEGREDDATDFSARIHWQDVSVRSLAQFADAWGKMIESMGIPKIGVWDLIPGVDQARVQEWKENYFNDAGTDGEINKWLREAEEREKEQAELRGGPNNPLNQPKVAPNEGSSSG